MADGAADSPLDRDATIDAAWQRYQLKRGVVLASFVLVPVLLGLPLGVAFGLALFSATPAMGVLAAACAWVLASAVVPGTILVWLRVAREEDASLADLLRGMGRAPALFVLTALAGGVCALVSLLVESIPHAGAVGAVMTGALMLGLLVSLVWGSERLQFAAFFVVDCGMGPLQALRASWQATHGRAMQLWRIDLVLDREIMARTGRATSGSDVRGASAIVQALVYLQLAGRIPRIGPRFAPAVGPSLPSAPPRYSCPRCGGPVYTGHAADAAIDGCVACGGVWIDNATAQRLLNSHELNTRLLADSFSRMARHGHDPLPLVRCPVCAEVLERIVVVPAGGVAIDVCRTHGTWFDRDELRRVADALGPPPALAVENRSSTYAQGAVNIGKSAVLAIVAALASIEWRSGED
jgi:Zn-finger nucleic acid-binding protein